MFENGLPDIELSFSFSLHHSDIRCHDLTSHYSLPYVSFLPMDTQAAVPDVSPSKPARAAGRKRNDAIISLMDMTRAILCLLL